MRSVLKIAELESRFPILAVENNCIVSKDGDITVAYEVELPELYTVTSAEYEAMHGTWVKAIKVLPAFSVVYKQDWFTRESYSAEGDVAESFLSRSYAGHFNERPYLRHRCFLYLTKTTRERTRRRSDFSTLCRGYILPKEITDWDAVVKFLEAVEQFERIMNDSGHVRMKRLRTEELVGTEDAPGLFEKYLALEMEDRPPVLQDICLDPEQMRVGDKRLCLHVLSDTEDLPASVATDRRYERLSTDRSDCMLSFAAPVGLLLSCNHIYSQYVLPRKSCSRWKRPRATCCPCPGTAGAMPSTMNGRKCFWTKPIPKDCFPYAATATCWPGRMTARNSGASRTIPEASLP